jgi:hypothetical protein
MVTTMDEPRAAAFAPEQAASLGTGTQRPGWNLDIERRVDDGRMLATQIGWFSVGLGLAELLAPDRLTRALGVEGSERLVQLYGLRELAKGVGILSQRRPSPAWLWARVAGDGLDLATLAGALDGDNPRRRNVLAAMAMVAGVTALDVMCARQLSQHVVHD